MITTQDSYLAEKRSLDAMYQRRELSLVWTTTPIQPLQSQYVAGNMLQVILQKSRHMIPIGQIQIAFRPIVIYGTDAGPYGTLAQKLMVCATAVQASDFIAFQSATVENNQLCSQTNLSQNRTRTILQNYMNMLKTANPKNILKGEECYSSGLIQSAGNGARNTGFEELSVTHPYSAATNNGVNNASRFEADGTPRAIIERGLCYNADFCIPVTGQDKYPSNTYFASQVTENADALLQTNIVLNQYPLLPLSVTPSISVYKAQQTRFADFRQRYLTQMVTSYYLPTIAADAFGTTNEANQSALNTALSGQQKVIYGNPINYETAIGGSGQAPQVEIPISSSKALYRPPEQYSACVTSVAETSIEFNPELGGIDMMCMENTQLIMQWTFNDDVNVLSSYLQPSYFGTTDPATDSNGATSANNALFLKCCALNGITYKVVDVCLRIPYYTYHDETAYSIVKEICYQPQSYTSMRAQIDNIAIGSSGQFFSRLSIGGSSILLGVWVFFVRNQTNVTNYPIPSSNNTCQAADCMVNLDGVNPPGVGDLRCVQSMDSYYIEMQDVYAQVNNKRYNVNAIPISNPALSTYLVVQSNLESAFGKHLNVSLREFTKNRFGFFIAINPFADRSQIITDNQLIIGCSLNFQNRLANSRMYGETDLDVNNKFSMLTYALTLQSMVDCAYVKIA